MTQGLQQLDLDEPTFATLACYAGRIGALLSVPRVQADPNLVGALDDFLGAVYALIFAKQNDFTDRLDRPIEFVAVQRRAKQLAGGQVRADGKWMAGFHFNSALFRVAAVYHRILKIVSGKNAYVPVLFPIVQARYPSWTNGKLDEVHDQVNGLKHTPRGVHDQRTITYDDAIAAAGELLTLVEAAWT